MSRFVKFLSIVTLSFVITSFTVAAQEHLELLVLIDQKISALEKDFKDLGASERHFQNVRTLLDYINKADVKPNDRFDRRLVVASKAISLQDETGIRADIIIVEKRNIALALLSAPLEDVTDPVLYSKLRERYSKVLVGFVRSIKKDRIVGYQPRPVYMNMPIDGRDNAATRSEKYKRFESENKANNESNRFQESLKNEVQFLEPKVIDFLKAHYQGTPLDQKELELFLNHLSG